VSAAPAQVVRRPACVRVLARRPAASLRLVCMPYAGGAAHVFHDWPELLGHAFEVAGVDLPGRGPRIGEPPVADLVALADEVADEVAGGADRPYALLGHSMGALLAFEVARSLRRRGARPPALLVACAHGAPREPAPERAISGLPRPRFVAELRRRGGTPPEVLANRELMDLLLPALRADFAACEGYRHAPEPPLACPILAIGGRDDREVTRPDLLAWSDHTSAGFDLRWIDSGHFFVRTHAAELAALVASSLPTQEEAG
jgi:medium-chain acyl-[acyl-carrier-protein] hydrolase